jgi:sulfate-transporting ATPase
MIQFAILGLGIAAVYTLLGQGIVLIFRGSGVVNLAQGAYAMVGAFAYYKLRDSDGLGFAPAFVVAVLGTALLGAITHQLVMKPLKAASPVARLIATLGVLIVLQSVGLLYFGSSTVLVTSSLPTGVFHIGSIFVGQDRLILLGIAVVLTTVLWAGSRFTLFGLVSKAVAENERAAASLAWSPDRVATANWAIGGALAAVGGILVVPLTGLQATNLTLIVIAALAAALIGGFSSFPLTLVGGLIVGISQSEMSHYWNQQGVSDALPLVVIVAILMLRGKILPVRGMSADRLPLLGSGIPRPSISAPLGALTVGLVVFVFPMSWNTAIGNTIIIAIMVLSVVVLTGYAGQVSLAQYALGGVGAFVTGRLIAAVGWPSWAAIVMGIGAAVVVGLIFALPAMRTRGVSLAVVTLGLGLSLQSLVFSNERYTGGIVGTNVGPLHLLGIDFDPIRYPDRFTLLTLAIFGLCAQLVSNVRRGRVGRRMIAVRSNERAAASLGINVVSAKLYAFGLSSALAGVSGILLGLSTYTIVFTSYDPISSIYAVALSVIGGVGYISGALFGATLSPNGVGSLIGNAIFGTNVGNWLTVAGGATLIVLLVRDPDGIASANAKSLARALTWIGARVGHKAVSSGPESDLDGPDPTRESFEVAPMTLEVTDAVVRFGGVVAVNGVTLKVGPGEIVGLIGPNGAGKTTLIDAVTGFVNLSAGEVRVNGVPVDDWTPGRRARLGVTRSFQSLELFEDLTVRENLLAASDARDALAYLTNMLWKGKRVLPSAALAAIHEFNLEADLDRMAVELPFGRRRLVGIARAIATGASVILLDEPGAGLGDDERAELASVIRHMAKEWGMSVLLVEHDISLVMTTCDRIVVVEFGQKLAEGSPEAIRRDDRVIAAYLGVLAEDTSPESSCSEIPSHSVAGDTDVSTSRP